MNRQKITTSFVLIGTILFHTFFWKEKMGINVLIFTSYILGTYFFIFNKKELSKEAILTSIITLLMATMVLINNSILSMVMFAISFISMAGFVHQKELKFFFTDHSKVYSILKLFLEICLGRKMNSNKR